MPTKDGNLECNLKIKLCSLYLQGIKMYFNTVYNLKYSPIEPVQQKD